MTHFTEECKFNIQTKHLLEDVLGGYHIVTDEDGRVNVGTYESKIEVFNKKENPRYTIDLTIDRESGDIVIKLARLTGVIAYRRWFEFTGDELKDKNQTGISIAIYDAIKVDDAYPRFLAYFAVGLYQWMLTGETMDPENNFLPLATHVDDDSPNVLSIANRLHVNTNGARRMSLNEREESDEDFVSFGIDKEFKIFKVLNAYGDVIDSRLFDDINELEDVITNNPALYKFVVNAYHDFCEMTPEVFDARYCVKPLEHHEEEEMDLSPEGLPFPSLNFISKEWTMEFEHYGDARDNVSYHLTNETTNEEVWIWFGSEHSTVSIDVRQTGANPDDESKYTLVVGTREHRDGHETKAMLGKEIVDQVDERYRDIFSAVYLAEQYRIEKNLAFPIIIRLEFHGVVLTNAVAIVYQVLHEGNENEHRLPLYNCNFELGYFGPCDAEGSFRHMTSIEEDMMAIEGAYIKDAKQLVKCLRQLQAAYQSDHENGITKEYHLQERATITKEVERLAKTYCEGLFESSRSSSGFIKTLINDLIRKKFTSDSGNTKATSSAKGDNITVLGFDESPHPWNKTISDNAGSNQTTQKKQYRVELPRDSIGVTESVSDLETSEVVPSFFRKASHYKLEKTSQDTVTISITLPVHEAEQLDILIKR